MAVFEIGTTTYTEDIIQIKKALSHMETRCKVSDSYVMSEPVSKFGWTFFKIAMQPILIDSIEKNFGDMIIHYKENKPEERLVKFLSDFFEARGCKIRLKIIEY